MKPVRAVESRDHRRRSTAVKRSLRGLRTQLSLLNQQVGGRVGMRPVDLDCLDVIGQHGPLTPSALSRRAGIHPATLTGILDRLERGRWISRERDPRESDRRTVLVRALPDRARELIGQYSDMNARVDAICADYTAEQLAVIDDFLHRTERAGVEAAERLGSRG